MTTMMQVMAMVAATWGLVVSSVAADETNPATVLAPKLSVAFGKEARFRFPSPELGKDQGAYLSLRCRIDSTGTSINGSYFVLAMAINEQVVDGTRLVNKAPTFTMRNGWEFEWYAGGMWRFPYTTSFENPNTGQATDIVDAEPFGLVLDVTDLLVRGDNDLMMKNTLPSSVPLPMVVEELRLEVRPRLPRRADAKPGTAPTGELATWQPGPRKANYQVEAAKAGGLTVTVGGQRYEIQSHLSFPNAGWNHLDAGQETSGQATWKPAVTKVDDRRYRIEASGAHYRLVREVTLGDEQIDIHDTLTNLTEADLGIWTRHELRSPAKPRTAYLCGNNLPTGEGEAYFAENPAVYVGLETSGLGLVARDDVMRVQSSYAIDKPGDDGTTAAGLRNRRFCLPAKGSYTQRWSLFPVEKDDYWMFVNAARRALDVNFTIPGSFVFIYTEPRFWDLSSQQIQTYVENRAAKFVSTGIAEFEREKVPAGASFYAHGTGFPLAQKWLEQTAKMLANFKAAAPSVQSLVYFHCYLSTEPGAAQKYADSQQIGHDGQHVYYDYHSTKMYPLFYPTLTNSYGQALQKYFDVAFNQVKADGIYWDEMSESGGHYVFGPEWDGYSCELHPTQYTVVRRISSTNLLSQEFRKMMVQRLQKEGRPLFANSMPHTETEANLKFVRFVETSPASMTHKTHLYCPLGLGDGVQSEKNEDDVARQIRRQLDRATLYAYYNGRLEMTHPNLTKYMFPFTPVEIRPGVMIGRERILISKAGAFGWGDHAVAKEVHVFDERGREVDGSAWVERDAEKGLTIVRLPSHYTAALLR